jgi:hypothetical protein
MKRSSSAASGQSGFKGEDAKPMALNQTSGDRRARLVKLRRAMRRLAKQDCFRVSEDIEMSGKGLGIAEVRQRLRFVAQPPGQFADGGGL